MSETDRFPHLSSARFVAFAAVSAPAAVGTTLPSNTLVWHFVQALMPFGIAVFALIVGFWAAYPFAARLELGDAAPSSVRWLGRRMAGLLPLYWVAAVAFVATGLVFTHGPNQSASPNLMSMVTLAHVFSHVSWPKGTSLWWAVAAQAVFYFVFPAVVSMAGISYMSTTSAVGERARNVRLVAIGAAGLLVPLAWRLMAFQGLSGSNRLLWPIAFLDLYTVGMALGLLRARVDAGTFELPLGAQRIANNPWFSWLCAFGALIVVANAWYGIPGVESSDLQREFVHYGCMVAAVFAVLPAIAANRPTVFLRPSSGPTERLLGHVSYGAFLWFPAAVSFLQRQERLGNFPSWAPIRLLAVWAIAGALGAASYAMIQRPIRKLSSRIFADPVVNGVSIPTS